MKVAPDGACPFCRELHGDLRCSAAMGKAIGKLKRIETLRAHKAWVCPPMPMPDPIVAEVDGLIVILPPVPIVVEPPLTEREIARAAAFVLTGKIRDVEEAILAVRGKVPILGASTRTWFEAAAGPGHSAKPPDFYPIVETVTPAARYAYLFAGRDARENWDMHGDRVGISAAAA